MSFDNEYQYAVLTMKSYSKRIKNLNKATSHLACKSIPLSARQRNATQMAFRWRADSDQSLHADWDYLIY